MRTWIKPPIIVDETGPIYVFESIELAERYLEPIDVEDNRYIAFDSTGRLLRLTSTPRSVTIEAAEEVPNHAERVKELLIDMLRACRCSDPNLSSLTLEELVQKSLPFATR